MKQADSELDGGWGAVRVLHLREKAEGLFHSGLSSGKCYSLSPPSPIFGAHQTESCNFPEDPCLRGAVAPSTAPATCLLLPLSLFPFLGGKSSDYFVSQVKVTHGLGLGGFAVTSCSLLV